MDASRARSSVAVFGSSEPFEGEPLYEQARNLGALLALHGDVVVTGGYGGVMEAACRGASEAGGRALGVTCAIFPDRIPNHYLGENIETRDLHDRTRELIARSDAFVILPGKSGTLAELTFLWALHRAGCLERRPVVLLGEAWRHLLRHLVRAAILEGPELDVTRVVDTPEEAVEVVNLQLASGRANG
jgi:uncharacterized protein (TIGR00730 family)